MTWWAFKLLNSNKFCFYLHVSDTSFKTTSLSWFDQWTVSCLFKHNHPTPVVHIFQFLSRCFSLAESVNLHNLFAECSRPHARSSLSLSTHLCMHMWVCVCWHVAELLTRFYRSHKSARVFLGNINQLIWTLSLSHSHTHTHPYLAEHTCAH